MSQVSPVVSTAHESSTYRRIRRRELHSPRSAASIVVATVVALALAYVATETVLAIAQQQPLLVSPADMGKGIAGVSSLDTGILIAAGAVVALIGIVLIVIALAPGRRARRGIESERKSVV